MKKNRIAAIVAAAGIAITLGGVAAPAALADGPDTPPQVTAAIEAQPWVQLQEGDQDYRVLAVGAILNVREYLDKEPTDTFDADLTAAVEEYQSDSELSVDGVVGDATWEALSDDVGTVDGDDPRNAYTDLLEQSLTHLGYDVDGEYDGDLAAAVRAFQEDQGIGVDGIIGPITFRAMYAEGAEDAS
ncbi:peptidoglycan-binding protein [Nocardiopsis sediminis]|uniref:Peptidoglycan-binding protein n=1 Tax=Nocardiopsis sediminis TaxID=1778267 RepID=A0ABV8FXV9_9ACTN